MDYTEVLTFVKQNPYCSLATIDGDTPRVRMMLSVFFDDGRIYFTTGAVKAIYGQLVKNPKAEFCYMAKDYSRMLRITAEMEFVDDRAKKQKLIEEKGYLKGFSADDPDFILMRMKNGRARFWTLKDNLREKHLEAIAF